VAESLFLYDPTDVVILQSAPLIAALWKIDTKQQREVEDLDDLSKRISAHKQLDTLVIYVHGTEGGFVLGGESYKLSDQKVSDAFAKVSTTVDHIRFEGCHVGEESLEMAAFGRLLTATYVSGFTWAHYSGSIEVTIEKGTTASELKKLRKYEKWIMPGTPSIATVATKARLRDIKWTFATEWFQFLLEPVSYAPYIGNNYSKYGSHTYKVRAEAKKRTVAVKDAKPSDRAAPPFEYVSVKL
jgi:hypothetical protein